jgi:MFS family permease
MPIYSRVFLMVSFIVGCTMMMMEMIGFRLLPPYFGYDVVVWGLLIGTILASLMVGYSVGGYLADRTSAITVLAIALSACVAHMIFYAILYQRVLAVFQNLGIVGVAVTAVLLFGVPMLFLSITSPCITKLLSKYETLGFTAGIVYGVATLGSISGVYYSAFYSLPLYGVQYTILLCVVLLFIAVVLVYVGSKSHMLAQKMHLPDPQFGR